MAGPAGQSQQLFSARVLVHVSALYSRLLMSEKLRMSSAAESRILVIHMFPQAKNINHFNNSENNFMFFIVSFSIVPNIFLKVMNLNH